VGQARLLGAGVDARQFGAHAAARILVGGKALADAPCPFRLVDGLKPGIGRAFRRRGMRASRHQDSCRDHGGNQRMLHVLPILFSIAQQLLFCIMS